MGQNQSADSFLLPGQVEAIEAKMRHQERIAEADRDIVDEAIRAYKDESLPPGAMSMTLIVAIRDRLALDAEAERPEEGG
jgi:hypothetical protein